MTAPAADIIGDSPGMLAAFRTVARVADSAVPLFVQGEAGTGKELLARLLHENSARRGGPFVPVDCAAIPEPLLESELFGEEDDAFGEGGTGRPGLVEQANGGTLFLNRIAHLSAAVQVRLLRLLEQREVERVGADRGRAVDIRLVAASTDDLENEVRAGRFREDLYYHLRVVTVTLPPLRERGDDIRLLAEHFCGRCAREHDRPTFAIAHETLALLQTHAWPDNVRQLQQTLESAILSATGPVLLPEHLPATMREAPAPFTRRQREQLSLPSLEQIERRHIQHVLNVTGGHLGRAADLLGIHRNTLRRKLQEHGLASDDAATISPAVDSEFPIADVKPPASAGGR